MYCLSKTTYEEIIEVIEIAIKLFRNRSKNFSLLVIESDLCRPLEYDDVIEKFTSQESWEIWKKKSEIELTIVYFRFDLEKTFLLY